jgi:uncharacterized protein YqeY
MTHGGTPIERRARTWLTEAVRSRDTVTVSALRNVLSAIANAEAVPLPASDAPTTALSEHVAGAAVGVGSAEAARRELSDDEVAEIVRGEIAEHHAAVEALGGRGERAERLRAEAVVLEVLLQEHPA